MKWMSCLLMIMNNMIICEKCGRRRENYSGRLCGGCYSVMSRLKKQVTTRFGFIPKIDNYCSGPTYYGGNDRQSKCVLKYRPTYINKQDKNRKMMCMYECYTKEGIHFRLQIYNIITTEEFWIRLDMSYTRAKEFFKKMKKYPVNALNAIRYYWYKNEIL